MAFIKQIKSTLQDMQDKIDTLIQICETQSNRTEKLEATIFAQNKRYETLTNLVSELMHNNQRKE